jgi:DNA invertase Pin-like site-specific DNA recombinase
MGERPAAILEVSSRADLACPETLLSLGKPTRKISANKTLGLQALVLPGFWAVMTAESWLHCSHCLTALSSSHLEQRDGWKGWVSPSDAKDRRPELDRFMADAHKRRFDVVAVWKFDRFARSVSHLLRALDTFRVLGVEFVSLSESLDTATPAGRMVFTVLGAVAELERSLIAERVRAGLRNARAKGRRLGRPRVAVDASGIARLRASGLSWPKIARELGVSVGTVYAAGESARGAIRS